MWGWLGDQVTAGSGAWTGFLFTSAFPGPAYGLLLPGACPALQYCLVCCVSPFPAALLVCRRCACMHFGWELLRRWWSRVCGAEDGHAQAKLFGLPPFLLEVS